MTSLTEAEHRVLQALSRVERGLQAKGPSIPAEAPRDETARVAIEDECQRLRQENEALRHELAALQAHRARLVAVVDEVEGRLEGAIDQIDELAGR